MATRFLTVKILPAALPSTKILVGLNSFIMAHISIKVFGNSSAESTLSNTSGHVRISKGVIDPSHPDDLVIEIGKCSPD